MPGFRVSDVCVCEALSGAWMDGSGMNGFARNQNIEMYKELWLICEVCLDL